ncbi:hypothetical protein [Paraburkholderia hospita]|jgi:hypothetical protein|uniref:hypothetical protein n=1 Tax=Paraburkholderia hospita TaxID=169430 RepID=UPI0009A7D0C9|nr:hypothetical protein [Paraburkholderia hospita]
MPQPQQLREVPIPLTFDFAAAMVEQATRLNPEPIFNIDSAGSMEKSLTVVMTGWREKTWTQSSKNTHEVLRRDCISLVLFVGLQNPHSDVRE